MHEEMDVPWTDLPINIHTAVASDRPQLLKITNMQLRPTEVRAILQLLGEYMRENSDQSARMGVLEERLKRMGNALLEVSSLSGSIYASILQEWAVDDAMQQSAKHERTVR